MGVSARIGGGGARRNRSGGRRGVGHGDYLYHKSDQTSSHDSQTFSVYLPAKGNPTIDQRQGLKGFDFADCREQLSAKVPQYFQLQSTTDQTIGHEERQKSRQPTEEADQTKVGREGQETESLAMAGRSERVQW